MARILVVDDEAAICWAFRSVLEAAGHRPIISSTARRALELFRSEAPDAVFLDVRLPDGSGLDLLDTMRAERPATPVVVITGHGGLDTAVRAIQAGAAEYLVKPLDLDGVRTALASILARPAKAPGLGTPALGAAPLLVGSSPPMQEVYKRIATVACAEVPVLILGESGTGKELVARAIHDASRRRAGPFEPIDCAALPPGLVESELYGHERGAFTGAVRSHAGRVRRADGGTLFFDEIGELSLEVQAKLLRFLAEREVVPVGGSERLAVDARVIAATNRPLEQAIENGSFREDLFYRLSVFTIRVPPLRERKGDIPALVARFLERAGAPSSAGRSAAVSEEALAVLALHDWPGNVRELRNAVEHAAILARGAPIGPEHLPAYVGRSPRGVEELRALAGRLIEEAEAAGVPAARHASDRLDRALLEEAIRRSAGSISAMARLLGWTRVTVRKRLRDLGMDARAEDDASS